MASEPPRLLALPAELRITIYELVFDDNVCDYESPPLGWDDRFPMPPLLQVSKQIYNEAVSVYWQSTTVIMPCYAVDERRMLDLLPRAQWGNVKKLIVHVSATCVILEGGAGADEAHEKMWRECMKAVGFKGDSTLVPEDRRKDGKKYCTRWVSDSQRSADCNDSDRLRTVSIETPRKQRERLQPPGE